MKRLAAFLIVFATPALLAQHGGGSSAGGSGLNSGNRASGISTRDDLRGFHEIMALQASREQKLAYAAMLQSAAGVSAELRPFSLQLNGEANKNRPAEILPDEKLLEDEIELARTLNKKFMEGFSAAQKNGLKETSKRLNKADAELEQEAKTLHAQVEANAASDSVFAAARSVERALSAFQRAQADLGGEMSIDLTSVAASVSDTTFNLPQSENIFKFSAQQISTTTSGIVTRSTRDSNDEAENHFSVVWNIDLSDLQLSIGELLRAEVNKSERCGERIEFATAALIPQNPSAQITAQLRYERWRCPPGSGHQDETELLGGNATLEIHLTPAVSDQGSVHLRAEIIRADAAGLLGDAIRSGSVGTDLNKNIAESVLAAIQPSVDFRSALPAAVRAAAKLKRVQFAGTSSGKLTLTLGVDFDVSNENLTIVNRELADLAAQAAERSAARPELVTR